MRVAVAGGGPGGLFFATLIRQADPSVEVTVFERNRADDTFGFGVVFSDRTLAGIHEADPVLREALTEHGRHWDEIEVRLKGQRIRCGGNGMAAVVRRTLLGLMQARARDVGAQLRFSTEVALDDLAGFDLVVAADGAGSKIREQLGRDHGADLGVEVETATAKFIWFGTDYLFDGLTFVHERSHDGVFAVHGYPISDAVSTFIVETDEASWRRAGLDEFDVTQPPGPSDMVTKDYLEKLFADQIDGKRLLTNNSRWGNFRTRRTKRWHTWRRSRSRSWATPCTPRTSPSARARRWRWRMPSPSPPRWPRTRVTSQARWPPTRRPPSRPCGRSRIRPGRVCRGGSTSAAITTPSSLGSSPTTSCPAASATRALRAAPLTSWLRATGAGWTPTVPSRSRLRSNAVDGRRRAVWSRFARTEAGPSPSAGNASLPLGDPRPGPWGAVLAAPDSETGLPGVAAQLGELARLDIPPVLVAVHGGTTLTRMLVCEQIRLHERLPALLIDPDAADDAPTRDRAVTAVLSGRADLVGVPR